MKVCCISDLHGNLPAVDPCDLLLIAGDICPQYTRPAGTHRDMCGQAHWLDTTFRKWLDATPATHVVAVAGNHDFVFEQRPDDVPALRWNYLQRTAVTLEGIRLWGSPDQLPFYDWAFNVPEDDLATEYEKIPPNTDIILSHGPPFGYGDLVPARVSSYNAGSHVGSKSLTAYLRKAQPRYLITGHIHDARGTYHVGPTTVINASILDEEYRMVHPPIYFTLEKAATS